MSYVDSYNDAVACFATNQEGPQPTLADDDTEKALWNLSAGLENLTEAIQVDLQTFRDGLQLELDDFRNRLTRIEQALQRR